MPPRSLLPRLFAPLFAAVTLVAGLVVTADPAAAVVTIDGPDVSSYQHPGGASINWAKVAASGHEFAIVKATEGTWYVNRYFRADYWGVRKAGMVRGSYHFAHPARPVAKTALDQATFYAAHLRTVATTKTLPPALDLEIDGGLSRTELITWAQDFLLDVRALTGRTPMIYTYPWFWRTALGDPAAFARYPLWMAAYHGSTPDAGAMLWQYTAGAKVSGIRGSVDMSKLLADPTTFAALADGTVATPWPATPPAAPVNVIATPTVGGATVSWLPADAGSSAITGYAVTVAPADGSAAAMTQNVSSARVTATFTGLTAGVPYLYTVTAQNAAGVGPAAAPSTPVVPQFPTRLAVTAPSLVSYGAPATFGAVLTRAADESPISGAAVTFATRAAGFGGWTTRGTWTTDDTGAVSASFSLARTDDVRMTYAGDGTNALAPTATVVTVGVRKLVAAHLWPTSTALGHTVLLTGHVTPAEGGVRVFAQQLVAGRWKSVAVTRTGPLGGFRVAVTPSARGALTFRALVASTAARVYGVSPAMVLTVS